MGVDQSPENLGIKLSQPFVDVDTAEDKDLIFSSSFPMLKEAQTGSFNINGVSGTDILVYEHKLGFHPFFVVEDDQSKIRLGSEWFVDENGFYFSGTATFPPTGGTGTFRWTIYYLPVFTPFRSDTLQSQSTKYSEYNPDYGLKAVKEDKSIDSTDLRDFTLHSRARGPLVDEVNVKDSWVGVDNHSVKPSLPYNPLFFAFALSPTNAKTYPMLSYGQAAPRLSLSSDNSIVIDSVAAATSKTSIIIFKDPFLAPVDRQVRY